MTLMDCEDDGGSWATACIQSHATKRSWNEPSPEVADVQSPPSSKQQLQFAQPPQSGLYMAFVAASALARDTVEAD